MPSSPRLPVKKLFGVGKVTAAKLNKLGAQTCADLRGWTLLELQHHFGSFGTRLHDLCRGIDNRDVSSARERKSVSVEETYTPDVPDLTACLALLPELHENLLGAHRALRRRRKMSPSCSSSCASPISPRPRSSASAARRTSRSSKN